MKVIPVRTHINLSDSPCDYFGWFKSENNLDDSRDKNESAAFSEKNFLNIIKNSITQHGSFDNATLAQISREEYKKLTH